MANEYASDLIAALRGASPAAGGATPGFTSFALPARSGEARVGLSGRDYTGSANNPVVQTMKGADPQYIKDWIDAHTYHPETANAGGGATGGASGGTGSSGGGVPKNDNSAPDTWGSLSEQEQAAWYAEHPNFAATTQFLQNMFGKTTLGMLQNKFDPSGVYTQQAIARGFSPQAGWQSTDNYEAELAALAEQARLAQLQQAAEAAEYHPSSSYSYSTDSGNSNSYNTYTGSNFTGTGW